MLILLPKKDCCTNQSEKKKCKRSVLSGQGEIFSFIFRLGSSGGYDKVTIDEMMQVLMKYRKSKPATRTNSERISTSKFYQN